MANSIPLGASAWFVTVQFGKDRFLTHPIAESEIEEDIKIRLAKTDGDWKIVIRTDTLIVLKDVKRRVFEINYWKDQGR